MNYSQQVLQHFSRPHHVGCFPKTEGNVITARAATPQMSDVVQLQVRIYKQNTIKHARFKAYGNPYTIAAMSWLTERIKGSAVTAITDVGYQDIIDALVIPPTKQYVAMLLEDLLKDVSYRSEHS